MSDGNVEYQSDFLNDEEANYLLDFLYTHIKWRSDKIKFFGKEYNIPRMQAWYGDENAFYSYSNIDLKPLPWTAELLKLRDRISKVSGEDFNSVLLNLYRDGQDSNGWHSDDEKELGPKPIIASLSLGQERVFHLKHKSKPLKESIKLGHGSLLIMKDETQKYWKHQIPKSSKTMKPRINLTFRRIFT
ncbi:alkylated DNA repair protein [Portibacter lacus]|uniref:Alkylated DNA repair protein n=2 Tax=Portibacter lacus TaxID=1099794 RepID=A0AA37SQG1_9BACT|nr:alkylated DNA repair protein [Portibacter lacus]